FDPISSRWTARLAINKASSPPYSRKLQRRLDFRSSLPHLQNAPRSMNYGTTNKLRARCRTREPRRLLIRDITYAPSHICSDERTKNDTVVFAKVDFNSITDRFPV